MKYKITALTPLLVGGGQELAPIDYMVWKDQVNVLDQPRIFKLLSRGPRLDGYLAQLRRADKLDFASWGGFAQNFSERRIPFEHTSSTAVWDKTHAEHLFIPTFAANHKGAYLPGSALKGALRTGLVFTRWSPATMDKLAASLEGERLPRRLSEAPEMTAGASQSRILGLGDSESVERSVFKVYMTRVANLDTRPGSTSLNWKVAGRGNVPNNRIADATPTFAEMAAPGTEFQGELFERKFLEDQQLLKALGWRSVPGIDLFLKAANAYATVQLEIHDRFAQASGLEALQQSILKLREQLDQAKETPNGCLLCMGWGGGFVSKSAFLGTESESFRRVLRMVPAFSRALREGAPFPKTRRIIFAAGQPAYLAGWVRAQFE
jgi:CRISPR-associated protein Csm5